MQAEGLSYIMHNHSEQKSLYTSKEIKLEWNLIQGELFKWGLRAAPDNSCEGDTFGRSVCTLSPLAVAQQLSFVFSALWRVNRGSPRRFESNNTGNNKSGFSHGCVALINLSNRLRARPTAVYFLSKWKPSCDKWKKSILMNSSPATTGIRARVHGNTCTQP